ncbi:hypothetical protein A2U01_0055013, partial [Trifolium medium]|nr:hypothetical protein [Trifolium medium]
MKGKGQDRGKPYDNKGKGNARGGKGTFFVQLSTSKTLKYNRLDSCFSALSFPQVRTLKTPSGLFKVTTPRALSFPRGIALEPGLQRQNIQSLPSAS